MKILVVALQFPFPPRSGVNMRVSQLLRQLARRHDVTLLSYAHADGPDRRLSGPEELSIHTIERAAQPRLGRRVAQLRSLVSGQPFAAREFHSVELERTIAELHRRERFDLIQLEGALLCGLALPAGVPVVLDEHNLDYEVFLRMSQTERSMPRRLFHRLEGRRFQRFEEQAWRQVSGCAVTSEREQPIVAAAAPATPAVVVPNGVDLEYFVPSRAATIPGTVVFNGTLGYRPNLDAVQVLVEQVWPLVRQRCPTAHLSIVGRCSDAERRRFSAPDITLTGEVPDIREHMLAADVVAVPVRMGGGTRLKVVEALAMGKAMVSTRLGCEGVAVEDRRHLLLADDPQDFADRIVELFNDQALREAIGRSGRDLAEREYSWDLSGDRLQALIDAVTPATPRALATVGNQR